MRKCLIALLALAPLTTMAAQRCEVQGFGTIFATNGRIVKSTKITDVRSITREKSWQDCYHRAIKVAKEYDSTVTVTVSGSRIIGGSSLADLYISTKWSFDDGLTSLFDSKGMVTKYTDKFESTAQEGDLRYFYDGTLFE
ncbi:hypothetical protein [Halobacteriovorax sp. HLS]|uniref:hypothetical protein n=1 Tax=Halobacteriovorax sp. HLS TaxID=2234000 RepID=UPI000FDC8CAD|nr:hypothetical protein [Halobacteriovorax sp. HLS]